MAKRKVLVVDEAATRLGRRTERRRARKEPIPPKEPAAEAEAEISAKELAAEVERLQAELASAQRRMIDLEEAADLDVLLLDTLNRRGFERVLRRSAAYIRRYGNAAALVYLDLDYFKPVNDRYGHAVGDLVLKAVGRTLQRSVRESDVVARLGGDEFGVLLWNVSEIQAAAKARALEAAVATTVVMHEGNPLSVGVSAGYAQLGPGDEPRDIISRADLAMYARKRAGRAKAG